MKKFQLFFSLLLLNLSFLLINAQDCNSYFPLEKGTVLNYSSYDAKDKVTGTNKQTVKDVKKESNKTEITVEYEHTDVKSKETFKGEYSGKCENGVFYFDMKNFVNQEMLAPYKDMQLDINGDMLDIPSSAKAGDVLKDGQLTIKVSSNGTQVFSSETKFINRKVEAEESITTTAGTFQCLKITYDIESKMIFMNIKSKAIQWYSKNVGLVKSQSFDKNGKLQGTELLTGLVK